MNKKVKIKDKIGNSQNRWKMMGRIFGSGSPILSVSAQDFFVF